MAFRIRWGRIRHRSAWEPASTRLQVQTGWLGESHCSSLLGRADV